MIAWVYVVVAGLFEVVWATSMKTTDGWTRLWPSVLTICAMLVSFFLLAKAMQSLPLGVAYTVWVGIGAIGAARPAGLCWANASPLRSGRASPSSPRGSSASGS